MDLGLADSVCLVTGSTGGIGLETAKLLRAEGATVVTTGRSGGDVRADLREPGEPERVVGETIERHGRLDVLVNNVGCSEIRKLEDVTDEIWQASFELNLLSAVRATRAALPGDARARAPARSSTSPRPQRSARRPGCRTTP